MWSGLSGNFSHLINKSNSSDSDSANIPPKTPSIAQSTKPEATIKGAEQRELPLAPHLPKLRADDSINNKLAQTSSLNMYL